MSEFICGFVCTIIGIVLYQRLYVRYRLRELTEERDEATRWKDAWRNMAGDLVDQRREDATAARNQIAQLKRQVGTPQWPVCIHCGQAMELGYGMVQKGLAWRCANHHCRIVRTDVNGASWSTLHRITDMTDYKVPPEHRRIYDPIDYCVFVAIVLGIFAIFIGMYAAMTL